MSYNNNILTLKIVLVGNSNVGKTSILTQYIHKKYYNYGESTIGAAFFSREYDFQYSTDEYLLYKMDVSSIGKKNIKIKLAIWDTAGQERYNSLIPMYYRGSHIILFVNEATNELISHPNALTKRLIGNINEKIFDSLDITSVKYIVFNKCDLLESDIYNRQINTPNKHNIKTKYVSAFKNINIDNLFIEAIIDYSNTNLKNILSTHEPDSLLNISSAKNTSYKCC